MRFDHADLDRLGRGLAEGVGVTQLVRTWVLERLNDDEPGLPARLSEKLVEFRGALVEAFRGTRDPGVKPRSGKKARHLHPVG